MLQFPIAMTPRTEPARALAWLSPVIAFALTVFTGFCLFAALGQDPVKALGVFLSRRSIRCADGLKSLSR